MDAERADPRVAGLKHRTDKGDMGAIQSHDGAMRAGWKEGVDTGPAMCEKVERAGTHPEKMERERLCRKRMWGLWPLKGKRRVW